MLHIIAEDIIFLSCQTEYVVGDYAFSSIALHTMTVEFIFKSNTCEAVRNGGNFIKVIIQWTHHGVFNN